MKINIELEPGELAEFLAVFASDSVTCMRRHEEALVDMLIKAKRIEVTSTSKEDDDGLVKNPEELYRGYTH